MKTLYLDFDGVLHPSSATQEAHFSQMHLLETALLGSRCQIVVSSSWRFHHSFKSITTFFPESLRDRVIGCTGQAYIGRYPRYNEILADASKRRVGSQWVALDDSWIEFPASCAELIRCNPNSGLTSVEAQRVMAWLGSG